MSDGGESVIGWSGRTAPNDPTHSPWTGLATLGINRESAPICGRPAHPPARLLCMSHKSVYVNLAR